MIPVPRDAFCPMNFNQLESKKYKSLFEKEYMFCLQIKEKILVKAEKIYIEQKEHKIVRERYCNFSKLESALKEWKMQ